MTDPVYRAQLDRDARRSRRRLRGRVANQQRRPQRSTCFRGTRLLRALSPDDPYQVVNVAQWDSVEQWRAALSAVQPDAEQRRLAETAGIRPQHFFYRVVSITPDPLEPPASA